MYSQRYYHLSPSCNIPIGNNLFPVITNTTYTIDSPFMTLAGPGYLWSYALVLPYSKPPFLSFHYCCCFLSGFKEFLRVTPSAKFHMISSTESLIISNWSFSIGSVSISSKDPGHIGILSKSSYSHLQKQPYFQIWWAPEMLGIL